MEEFSALELPDGPKLVIETEISDERLQILQDMFKPLAEKQGRKILFFNPNTSKQSFRDGATSRGDALSWSFGGSHRWGRLKRLIPSSKESIREGRHLPANPQSPIDGTEGAQRAPARCRCQIGRRPDVDEAEEVLIEKMWQKP